VTYFTHGFGDYIAIEYHFFTNTAVNSTPLLCIVSVSYLDFFSEAWLESTQIHSTKSHILVTQRDRGYSGVVFLSPS
jgi:hypothetical protein